MIIITKTKISFLPNDLYIGKNLYLSGTKINSLPDNLHIGGKIYKYF